MAPLDGCAAVIAGCGNGVPEPRRLSAIGNDASTRLSPLHRAA
jgi:hypothetical protein